MKRMYGVEMQAPAGKLPGFYAQVIHKIGDNVRVADRDQQLLIVENEDELQKLMQILDKAHMLGDRFDLWQLPPGIDWPDPDPCGFVSGSNRMYAYVDQVTWFRLDETVGTNEDRWAALQQMKEHVLTSFAAPGDARFHLIDRDHTTLINGIARAYRVSVQWLGE